MGKKMHQKTAEELMRVNTTQDGFVRIAILPPAASGVWPVWVAFGRKDAIILAFNVIRAALFGSFRETTHKG